MDILKRDPQVSMDILKREALLARLLFDTAKNELCDVEVFKSMANLMIW